MVARCCSLNSFLSFVPLIGLGIINQKIRNKANSLVNAISMKDPNPKPFDQIQPTARGRTYTVHPTDFENDHKTYVSNHLQSLSELSNYQKRAQAITGLVLFASALYCANYCKGLTCTIAVIGTSLTGFYTMLSSHERGVYDGKSVEHRTFQSNHTTEINIYD